MLYVPVDVEFKEWLEIEIDVDVVKKVFKINDFEVCEIERRPRYAYVTDKRKASDLYRDIRVTVGWMIKEGKYSKEKIVEEISIVYGLHPEYARFFVELAMDEFRACEIDGKVVGRFED